MELSELVEDPMKKNILANLLIIIPILMILYIYAPILKTEFDYHWSVETVDIKPKSVDFGIVISKLGINELIIPEVDPFDSTEYLPALTQGVAHANTTVTPDQSGTVYLFAHSSDNPVSITRYNTAFYLLPRLDKGDEIKLFYRGQEFTYLVSHKEIVKPNKIEVLTQTSQDQLILQTCTPVGTAVNRLLVYADPV